MSELDKAISELVSAFQEIMPSAQVFVAQPKAQPEVKPNSKATGISPEAEYWRQKYMNTLDKYNTLLTGQSIRTKTHDTERSTIAHLQHQVASLTKTVQEKNREIDAMKKSFNKTGSDQRVAIINCVSATLSFIATIRARTLVSRSFTITLSASPASIPSLLR